MPDLLEEPGREAEWLVDEVRLLWNAMVRRGERVHQREQISMGMRAMLEFLLRVGPATVPDIARARGVSRQHVQTLMNSLLEKKLVRAAENPAHRRSPLMELSGRGRQTIERMRRREADILEEAGAFCSPGDLRSAAETLRALRRAIDP